MQKEQTKIKVGGKLGIGGVWAGAVWLISWGYCSLSLRGQQESCLSRVAFMTSEQLDSDMQQKKRRNTDANLAPASGPVLGFKSKCFCCARVFAQIPPPCWPCGLHVLPATGCFARCQLLSAFTSCSCLAIACVWLLSSLNFLPEYLGVEWYYANVILSGN